MVKVATLLSSKEDLMLELELFKKVFSRSIQSMGDLISSFEDGIEHKINLTPCNDVHMLSRRTSTNAIIYKDRPQLRGGEELIDLLDGSDQTKPSIDFSFSVSEVLREFFSYENNVTCMDREALIHRYDIETGSLLNECSIATESEEEPNDKFSDITLDLYTDDFWCTDTDVDIVDILGKLNNDDTSCDDIAIEVTTDGRDEIDDFWDRDISDEDIVDILGKLNNDDTSCDDIAIEVTTDGRDEIDDFWDRDISDEDIIDILGKFNDDASCDDIAIEVTTDGRDEIDDFWDRDISDEDIIDILGKFNDDKSYNDSYKENGNIIDDDNDEVDDDFWDDISDNEGVPSNYGDVTTDFEDEERNDDSGVFGVSDKTVCEFDFDPYSDDFWSDDGDGSILDIVGKCNNDSGTSFDAVDTHSDGGGIDEGIGSDAADEDDEDIWDESDEDDNFEEDADVNVHSDGGGIDEGIETDVDEDDGDIWDESDEDDDFNDYSGYDEFDEDVYELITEDNCDNTDHDVITSEYNSAIGDSSTSIMEDGDKEGVCSRDIEDRILGDRHDVDDDIANKVIMDSEDFADNFNKSSDITKDDVVVCSSNSTWGYRSEDESGYAGLGFIDENNEDSSGIANFSEAEFNSSTGIGNNSPIGVAEEKSGVTSDKSQSYEDTRDGSDLSVQEPTDIRQFLRKHPKCDYDFARKYFTKKQLDDAIKIGKVIKKGNTLRLM